MNAAHGGEKYFWLNRWLYQPTWC